MTELLKNAVFETGSQLIAHGTDDDFSMNKFKSEYDVGDVLLASRFSKYGFIVASMVDVKLDGRVEMLGGEYLGHLGIHAKSNRKILVDAILQGVVGQFSNGKDVPLMIEAAAEITFGATAEKLGGN